MSITRIEQPAADRGGSNLERVARVLPEVSRSHAGVALSVAVHAVVGGMMGIWAARQPRPALLAAHEAEPGPEPIEIEVYVAPVAATPITTVDRRPTVPAPKALRIARVRPTSEPTAPAPTDTAAAHRIFALPSVAALPPPSVAPMEPAPALAALDGIAKPGPAAALPTPSTFTMRVALDGTARITDRRNFHFALGTNAAEIEEGRAEQWMDEHHERSNAVDMKLPPVGAVIARFDVTDWAMRSAGQDPYAHEKLKVLDATRDARAQIGARHREQQAYGTPALVRATLDGIVALPPKQRGAALRELWRDCDDSTAGEIARATIARYVATHAEFSVEDRTALSGR